MFPVAPVAPLELRVFPACCEIYLQPVRFRSLMLGEVQPPITFVTLPTSSPEGYLSRGGLASLLRLGSRKTRQQQANSHIGEFG